MQPNTVIDEADHPGVIDLKDDPDTVLRLLELVNIIAEQMVSPPKAIRCKEESYSAKKRESPALMPFDH